MLIGMALALAPQLDVSATWPLADGRYAEMREDGTDGCGDAAVRQFTLRIVHPAPHADSANTGTVSLALDAPVDGDYILDFYAASTWGLTGRRVLRIDGGEAGREGDVVAGISDAPLQGELRLAMWMNLDGQMSLDARFDPGTGTDPVRDLSETGRLREFSYCGATDD